MEKIALFQTNSAPKVMFDAERAILVLQGKSTMEDAITFYDPLIEWVSEYIETPRNTSVVIDLEYFNTPTNKFLQALFSKLALIRNKGFSVIVYWLYDKDDEDIWESGYEFSNRAETEFIFIERVNYVIGRIEIKKTEVSPNVIMDPGNGIIEIEGNSNLLDPKSFYSPLIEWLSIYIKKPKDTIVTINLENVNSITNRFLQLLFTMLSDIKLNGSDLLVKWFYNNRDEDNFKSGQDFASLSGLEFNFIER